MTDSKLAAAIVGFGPGVSGAVAAALAERGHPLALIARSAERLGPEADRLKSAGSPAVTRHTADAGDAAAVTDALAKARAAVGDIGVLLFNAARWRAGPVLATTPETLEEDFRVDVVGALAAARAVAPAMVERGSGTLLFTGGGLALRPSPDAPSLSIGKAAIRSLALVLAAELAPKGVRVGTVTIAGAVTPGTPFAPERIAGAFLRLHDTPPDPATAEVVFDGAAPSSTISFNPALREGEASLRPSEA